MVFPLPSISVTFGTRSKDDSEKKAVAATGTPLQTSYSVDPVMVMMLTAIILLSSAMLVYAARS
jgi:hypothetical protein